MKISSYIAELLKKHDCVIVPNFGGFLVQAKSVVFIQQEHLFLPPSTEVRFNQNLKRNDELLVSKIVIEEEITHEEAQERINQYIDEASQSLIDNKSFIINKVGKLYMDNNDNLRFQSDQQHNYNKNSFGLPKLNLEEIDRTQNEREKLVKTIQTKQKNSKLGVTIIAAAAIFAIALATTFVLGNHGTPKQQKYIKSNLGMLFKKDSYETPSIVANKTKNTPKAEPKKAEATVKEDSKNVQPQNNVAKITEPNVAQPTKKVAPVTKPAKTFHIVLGLFRSEVRANRKLNNAKLAGYKNTKIIKGQKYYRVVIPFDENKISKIKAENQVRDNYEAEAWVWEAQYK